MTEQQQAQNKAERRAVQAGRALLSFSFIRHLSTRKLKHARASTRSTSSSQGRRDRYSKGPPHTNADCKRRVPKMETAHTQKGKQRQTAAPFVPFARRSADEAWAARCYTVGGGCRVMTLTLAKRVASEATSTTRRRPIT